MRDDPDFDGLMYAFDVDANGRGRHLRGAELSTPPQDDVAYRWVHLDFEKESSCRWISDWADETVAHLLTAENTRPQFAPYKEGFILTLRGVNLNPDANPEDMVSVRVFMRGKTIVSTRRRRLMAVVALREALEALASDHDFLLQGDVFTKDQIDGYIALKMEEVETYEHTPHPVEYGMYYSC